MDNTAFTFGDSKEASLYFDYVIPLGLIFDSVVEYGWEDFFESFEHTKREHWEALIEVRKKFDQLLPPELNVEPWVRKLADVNMQVIMSQLEPQPGVTPLSIVRAAEKAKQDGGKTLKNFMAEAGIQEPSFTASAKFFTQTNSSTDDAQITIANLNLIDASKASMEQILAFREDAQARMKLRKLRLFAKENYFGKSKSFVEDDLHTRIYDYEREIKRWSFEKKRTAVSMFFKSKIMAGAAGGSLIGAIVGEPVISAASLALGTIAEFSNIALEVTKVKFEAEAALQGNPVSYIHDVKKVLGKIE
jgi:hypothetical protein